MLSRPIASGAMLAIILSVAGAAALQPGDGAPDANSVEIETADVDEPVAPERTASVPSRVVDPAGFPAVPEAPAVEEPAPAPSAVVTVNGRPLGSTAAPTPPVREAAPEPAVAAQPAPIALPEPETTQVAAIAPPLPKPRPADLPVREAPVATAAPAIDYDAIAEAAYGSGARAVSDEFMSLERRQQLAPLGNEASRNPNRDELVGVVGPNGEVIWVYEEQMSGNRSGVTFQRQTTNPFGFVYDESGFGW